MSTKMKKMIAVIAVTLLAAFVHPAFAGEQYKGLLIAEKTLEGYALRYSLLNPDERKEVVKGMEGMKMPGMSDSPDVTHHLALYIKGTDGKPVSGKIGFNITNPDGTAFKTMTMGFPGGYGADVMFKAKGIYKIRMKAVIAGKTINDETSFEVK
ncbi:MAG: hypothetical protein A2277_04380 [Desulfobacterales bacterium RIFOXYA12_FULL_46_15]|nr:MAG: hypothetical protein A2277_04380 [Desulfobacterales bacterium RIFOXYA12_FULL_46_15]